MSGPRFFNITFVVLLICTCAYGANWQGMVNRNKNALITLRYYAPYKLNNENIGTFFATGTIVDKEKGIVLADRETTQVSPAVITGYLQNYEEIELKTIYYDPIHNFAFLQFDPHKVKWSDIGEIKLGDSDDVKLGDAIVLLSTTKNKNLGVVHGNIVDIIELKRRNDFKYQDYNINYFDTSLVSVNEGGGIILNEKGEAIALHAWIHEADPFDYSKDKNFYAELPINFIKDVLSDLKKGKPIQRGDLGLVLNFLTFSQALEFKVPNDSIDAARKKTKSKGLLYISSVVGSTPNDDKFKVGDIILKINGQYIGDKYLILEKMLDENVGKRIDVTIYRNEKPLNIKAGVFDLLKTKTNGFALFSGGVFQDIPWFIKVKTNVGNRGVYVSSYGNGSPLSCANFFENNVITNINGVEINNLGDFYNVIKLFKHDMLMRIRYVDLVLNNKEYVRTFRVNSKFFPTRFFTKGNKDGDWHEIKR